MLRLLTVLALVFTFSPLAEAADRAPVVKYTPATIENNSNALFKIGILRPSDPLAVDEYMRIHHCGLYEQYGNDDVAWARLRDAQARELSLSLPAFNENLEVEGSILLGTYDVATGRYAIARNAFDNVGNVTLIQTSSGAYNTCASSDGKSFVPRAHPLRMSARLAKPFTMADFPAARSAAEEMIKIITARMPDELTQRTALVVMRLHLKGPDPLSGATEPSTITVTADLDEIQIYDGPDRNLLLYSQKFTDPKDAKTGSR